MKQRKTPSPAMLCGVLAAVLCLLADAVLGRRERTAA